MKARVEWDDRAVRAVIQSGGSLAVRSAAHMLLDESRKQVPLDTGALQRSGAVDSNGLSATVSYDTPYAVRWHEHNAHFQRGRKKKYLEDPCNDSGIQRRILDYLRSGVRF